MNIGSFFWITKGLQFLPHHICQLGREPPECSWKISKPQTCHTTNKEGWGRREKKEERHRGRKKRQKDGWTDGWMFFQTHQERTKHILILQFALRLFKPFYPNKGSIRDLENFYISCCRSCCLKPYFQIQDLLSVPVRQSWLLSQRN